MEEHIHEPMWHIHPLRVRYQETDQMQVVFHGNYLTWFEIGRTELVRYFGMAYKDIEAKGLLLPVVDLDCKYISPARYDDRVIVCTTIGEYSNFRLSFRSEVRKIAEHDVPPLIWRGETPPGELLVRGGTRHVWVNTEWRPARVDKTIPELFRFIQSFGRGEAAGASYD